MGKGLHGVALRHVQTLFNVGTLGGLTDGQLLERYAARGGEAAELAFTALVERHGPMVLRVCHAVLRDEHEAHDAFQATFLVLARRAGSLWVRDSLGPWLHQVACRIASCARSAAARRRRHERKAAEGAAQSVRDEGRDDLGPVVHEEVGRLPERYRAAIVLCCLEGLTHEQAARHLGWPIGTVQSRLARGRERLRQRLTRRGLVPSAGLIGAAGSTEAASAAVPASLVNDAVQVAMCGAAGRAMAGVASATVTALARSVLRTLLMNKLKSAAVALSLVAVTTLGVAVLARGMPRADEPPRDALKTAEQAAPPPAREKEEVEVEAAAPPPAPKKEEVVEDDAAFTLAVSPDSKTVAAGCTDGTVKLLDLSTGKKRATLTGLQRGYIRAVAFAPDGKMVAGAGDDNKVRLWDVATGELRHTFPGLGELERAGASTTITSLAFAPDGQGVAVAGGGSIGREPFESWAVFAVFEARQLFEFRVLDVRTGRLAWSHLGRGALAGQLAFSPDGKTLAAVTRLAVKLWDVRTGDLKQTLKAPEGGLWGLAFSPDRALLAGSGYTFSGGKTHLLITLWDLRTGAVPRTLDGGECAPVVTPGTLAFAPDGRTLAGGGQVAVKGAMIAIAGEDRGRGQNVVNCVKLWDVATGRLLWTSAEGGLGVVTSLVFAPDGKSLVCCDSAATTRIDARSGQIRQDLMKRTRRPAQ